MYLIYKCCKFHTLRNTDTFLGRQVIFGHLLLNTFFRLKVSWRYFSSITLLSSGSSAHMRDLHKSGLFEGAKNLASLLLLWFLGLNLLYLHTFLSPLEQRRICNTTDSVFREIIRFSMDSRSAECNGLWIGTFHTILTTKYRKKSASQTTEKIKELCANYDSAHIQK
jgi:hypothetical protein